MTIARQKSLPFAQEIYLQELLGTVLYDKLCSDITGNTLSGNYETLVKFYIKDYLLWKCYEESVAFIHYSTTNGGVFEHQPENGTPVEPFKLKMLTDKAKNNADAFAKRLQDHLCFYAGSRYPEYYQNKNDDVFPDGSVQDSTNMNFL